MLIILLHYSTSCDLIQIIVIQIQTVRLLNLDHCLYFKQMFNLLITTLIDDVYYH